MNRSSLVGVSVAAGVLFTLLAGLVTLRTLAGGTHYGFPMAWSIRRVLAPEYFPWRVNWVGLVVDLVVWTALVLLVLLLYDRFGHRSTDGKPT
jgi:hypothetical protein